MLWLEPVQVQFFFVFLSIIQIKYIFELSDKTLTFLAKEVLFPLKNVCFLEFLGLLLIVKLHYMQY